ncbi:MAG: hypothetical protein ACR2FM_03780, partial [Candidatus Saccharimonadales bacterium]
NNELWESFYKRVSSNGTVAMFISVFSIAGVASIFDQISPRKLWKNKPNLTIILLMLLATGGVLMTQIVHSVGYGGFYFRYFLPVLLPFSLFIAYGLLQIKWARGQLVVLSSIALSVTTIFSIINTSENQKGIPLLSPLKQATGKIYDATATNGITAAVPTILLATLVLGSFTLAVSLFVLSKHKRTKLRPN